ncbi:MAG: S8 family serine peptidase [Thermoplasmatales archaeon]|nr:MAG: S8 family serine peptidase [Thermoplasmatales archaeon]
MKKKIVGILVGTLLIATVLPAVSAININIDFGEIKYIDDTIKQEFIPKEIIVKFRDKPVMASLSIENLYDKYQINSIEKVFKNSENTILDNIYLLKVPKDTDLFSIIEDFTSHPDVEYAETNGLSQTACLIPDDVDFDKQWALENTGQTGGKIDSDIDATDVWDIETGSSDIVIAVIDSGIDYNHPDFEDNIWNNEDEIPDNDIDDDENGFVDDIIGWDWWYDDNDPLDDMGHGTPCAGIAGALGNNGIGGAGVCWNCKIMPLKIMNGTGWTYFIDIAKSIEYAADNGADVISMSLRIYSNKTYIHDAVNYAYEKGVVLVGGVGNENISDKAYPAAYNNVIAVAGTDHNDNRMVYYCEVCQQYHGSNFGPWVDVAAPALDIFSTMPTYHVWFNDIYELEQNYDIMPGGTSFATPHVSGVAALMLSKNPSLSPDEVKSRIRKYVDPYDSAEYIGTGRINAHQAIKNSKNKINLERDISSFEKIEQLTKFLEYYPNMFSTLRQILQILLYKP